MFGSLFPARAARIRDIEHENHRLNMELDLQSLFGLLCTAVLIGRDHRVHRVVTSAFWRTFSHEGKISLGWCEWGVHAH
jgi:hypothetical protein